MDVCESSLSYCLCCVVLYFVDFIFWRYVVHVHRRLCPFVHGFFVHVADLCAFTGCSQRCLKKIYIFFASFSKNNFQKKLGDMTD